MTACVPWFDNPLGRTVICNSANRPTGAQRYPGLVIYETDTFTYWFWNGAAWVGIPAGTMGYAQQVNNHSGISTMTDISFGGTPLQVTWTAFASRRYRVTMKALLFSSAVNDNGNLWIRNAASVKQQAFGVNSQSASHGINVYGSAILTGISGSQTMKMSVERATGSGTFTVAAGTDFPAFVHVEDIGS